MSASIPKRIAVAVSGGGRTLENLLARQSADAGYEVQAVIASRECRGAEIARQAGLPLLLRNFPAAPGPDVTEEVYSWLARHEIDLVALGGFLRPFPLKPEWIGRIVNIHPALLPAFGGHGMYGAKVHRAVIAAGEKESGATVHFVDEEYDRGPILAQAVVEVRPDDTPDTLAERVFAAECELYPQVLRKLAAGELPLSEGRVLRFHHAGA